MNSGPLLFLAFMIVNSNKQPSDTRHLGYPARKWPSQDDLQSATKDVTGADLADTQSEHGDGSRPMFGTLESLGLGSNPMLESVELNDSATTAEPNTKIQRCCSQEHNKDSCSEKHNKDICSQEHNKDNCSQEHNKDSCSQEHNKDSCSQEHSCSHDLDTDKEPQPLPQPLGDEGYYCPDKQRWLHQDSLLRGSSQEATAVTWEEGDMLVQCIPSVLDYNCLKVGFKSGTSPGVISLSGWSVSMGSSSASDGYVYEYFGLYKSLANKWEPFTDCNGTKVFTVAVNCLGPELEDISPTVIAQEVMLCPVKVLGKHPLFHMSVKGCLLRKHGPMERFTLPECRRGKETCLSDEWWMSEEGEFQTCMFYSNAGGYAPSAMYSKEGYSFPALADTGPLIGKNNEYFLEVDFPRIKSVSELKICGGSARGEKGKVKSFSLAYRDMYAQGSWTYVQDKDGSLMYFEEKRSGGRCECSRPCPYTLEPPIITAGIRIYPQTWSYDKPYLRLDIRACQIHTCSSCGEEEADDDYTELSGDDEPLSFLDPLPADVNSALASEMDVVQPPDSLGIARVGPRDTLSTQSNDTRETGATNTIYAISNE